MSLSLSLAALHRTQPISIHMSSWSTSKTSALLPCFKYENEMLFVRKGADDSEGDPIPHKRPPRVLCKLGYGNWKMCVDMVLAELGCTIIADGAGAATGLDLRKGNATWSAIPFGNSPPRADLVFTGTWKGSCLVTLSHAVWPSPWPILLIHARRLILQATRRASHASGGGSA